MVYLQVLKTAECNSIKAGKKNLIHSILKRRDCVIGKGGRGLTLSILFFFQDNFVHPYITRKFAPEFTPLFSWGSLSSVFSLLCCVL